MTPKQNSYQGSLHINTQFEDSDGFIPHQKLLNVSINSPIDFIASIPYLLGFQPGDAMLLARVHRKSKRLYSISDFKFGTDGESIHQSFDRFMNYLDCDEAEDVDDRFMRFVVVYLDDEEQINNQIQERLDVLNQHSSLSQGIAYLVCQSNAYLNLSLTEDPVNISEVSSGIQAEMVGRGLSFEDSWSHLVSRLESEPNEISQAIAKSCSEAREKVRRSNKAWRLVIEDELVDWLTRPDNSKNLSKDESPYSYGSDPEELSMWILALSDRRVREPVLKRLHNCQRELKQSGDLRSLNSIQSRLIFLVRHSPSLNVASVASVLAIVSWINGSTAYSIASAEYALRCSPLNVLAKLAQEAIFLHLGPEAWSEIMDAHTLAELRSGRVA